MERWRQRRSKKECRNGMLSEGLIPAEMKNLVASQTPCHDQIWECYRKVLFLRNLLSREIESTSDNRTLRNRSATRQTRTCIPWLGKHFFGQVQCLKAKKLCMMLIIAVLKLNTIIIYVFQRLTLWMMLWYYRMSSKLPKNALHR